MAQFSFVLITADLVGWLVTREERVMTVVQVLANRWLCVRNSGRPVSFTFLCWGRDTHLQLSVAANPGSCKRGVEFALQNGLGRLA